MRRTKSTLPIPRACSRRARFSALAAAISRFALYVCALAGTWLTFVVGGTDRDGDVGGTAGGGSGGGVVGIVDSWQASDIGRSGTVGVVRVGNGVMSGLATSVDALALDRFNKDPSCEGRGACIESCNVRLSLWVHVCDVSVCL